jgi:hypothetical protein
MAQARRDPARAIAEIRRTVQLLKHEGHEEDEDREEDEGHESEGPSGHFWPENA